MLNLGKISDSRTPVYMNGRGGRNEVIIEKREYFFLYPTVTEDLKVTDLTSQQCALLYGSCHLQLWSQIFNNYRNFQNMLSHFYCGG